jgi:hypothetical protein
MLGELGFSLCLCCPHESVYSFAHPDFAADTYSVGKAAMNMVVRKYAGALKAQGSEILLISVFPGVSPAI